MAKPKVDKSDIFITYHVNGDPRMEYIPPNPSKLEKKIRTKYLRFLDRISAPTYYWHYRFMLGPTMTKAEDIKFLIHVYENHDFAPTGRVEKRHFRNAWNLYGYEFDTFIRPKLEQEQVGHGVIHQYALAYYKRWLRPFNPNFTRMYHGVDAYEMLDMYDEMLKNIKKDIDSTNNRMQYYDAKARLKLKEKPKKPKKTRAQITDEQLELQTKYKDFRTIFWAVDFLLSWLSYSALFQSGGVNRPFWDGFFMFIGYMIFIQTFFIPIFYLIRFTRYQGLK